MSLPTDARGLRGGLSSYIPNWLSNRPSLNVGFRLLWVIALFGDLFIQAALEGLRAAWPGRGDPSALPLLGVSRGLVRGFATSETDEHFIDRLKNWRIYWKEAGKQIGIARQLREFLPNHPSIRVVNRQGRWTTIETDGTITFATRAWDWDSVSNPERANYWSDEWVIVYPDPWAYSTPLGTFGKRLGEPVGPYGLRGIGHATSRAEYTTAKAILRTWKAAHSYIRAIIFTVNPYKFDPDTGFGFPDGEWGMWGEYSGSDYILGHRDLTECRYWEGTS